LSVGQVKLGQIGFDLEKKPHLNVRAAPAPLRNKLAVFNRQRQRHSSGSQGCLNRSPSQEPE